MQKHVVKALNNICQGRVSIFRESILYIFYPFNGVDLDVLCITQSNIEISKYRSTYYSVSKNTNFAIKHEC